MKLQIFEVLSVVKKVVLKRHVVRIPFPVNLAVNLRSVYFDQDEGRKQPRTKDVVHLVTGLLSPSPLVAVARTTMDEEKLRINHSLARFSKVKGRVCKVEIEDACYPVLISSILV